MKRKAITLACAAALAVAGCQHNSQPEPTSKAFVGTPIAYVNDEPISQEMFDYHLERRTGGQPQLASEEDRQALLQELVDMALLAQEAERQGIASRPDVIGQLHNLRLAVLAQALVTGMLAEEPDEAAIQAEYDKHFKDQPRQEYHARHILVDSEEKATELIDQLDQGADFAQLAEENSTDSSSANGGDLGWFQAEQMVQPFAEAVQQLSTGSYTKTPVQTQFGWHVIKLEDSRPVEPPPLEAVRQQLIALLAQERVEARIEELRRQANIRTEPQKNGTSSLEEAHKALDMLN